MGGARPGSVTLLAAVRHRDWKIALDVDARGNVGLAIDDAVRARSAAPLRDDRGCYLATPLQTAYEYHVLVEAWITPLEDALEVRIRIEGTDILNRRVTRSGPGSAESLT